MIIILSPAKTFNRTATSYDSIPVFENDATSLISKLQLLSIKELKTRMNLSETLAKQTFSDYQTFGKMKIAAIHGYHGHQFRHFDVNSLEQKGLKENVKYVYILSGLYGIVNAYDGISPYRLEMKDKTLSNLYSLWKPKISYYLKTHFENDVIYNLASEEYGKLIKDLKQVITIQFFNEKDHQLSIHSMEAKRMRGLFARYLVRFPHIDPKGIKLEGYTYSIQHSSAHQYTFVRLTP